MAKRSGDARSGRGWNELTGMGEKKDEGRRERGENVGRSWTDARGGWRRARTKLPLM